MKTSLTVIACMAALVVLVAVQSAAAQGKIEGVWKITEASMSGPNAYKDSNPQPNLVIYTKKHFSSTLVTSDKPRPDQPLEKATDAQKAAAWDPFIAAAGTYELKGTTFTGHNLVSKDPEDMKPGNFSTWECKIEKNTFTCTLKATEAGPLANPITIKAIRLE